MARGHGSSMTVDAGRVASVCNAHMRRCTDSRKLTDGRKAPRRGSRDPAARIGHPFSPPPETGEAAREMKRKAGRRKCHRIRQKQRNLSNGDAAA
ncbi:hypothetical protein ROHU_026907 [Labeo rohita]|uniref:Uncharacterized protein n=1 Tax=Labeo rohita TaxID=84645 RepID=A0A498MKA1_LABRO|nr:hypothetical protein ROHU_026907 [Labeo rohita]